MIRELRAKGFAALRLHLNGYRDGATAIHAARHGLLGPPAVLSKDSDLAVRQL